MGRRAKAFKGANTPARNKEEWLLKEPGFSVPPSCASFFFSSFLLSWMTLPVSNVIKSFGEAQSRTGRRAQSGSQKAWVLSLADDLTLSTSPPSSLVPASLPSRALSFCIRQILTECLLCARHSSCSRDKTDTVLPSGGLYSRKVEDIQERARNKYVPTGNAKCHRAKQPHTMEENHHAVGGQGRFLSETFKQGPQG